MKNRTPFLPPCENPKDSFIAVPPEQPANGVSANPKAGILCTDEADRDMGALAEIHAILRRSRVARSRAMDSIPPLVTGEGSHTAQCDGVNATPKNGAVTYLQLACVDGRHADCPSRADTLERASREATAILRSLLGRCGNLPREM